MQEILHGHMGHTIDAIRTLMSGEETDYVFEMNILIADKRKQVLDDAVFRMAFTIDKPTVRKDFLVTTDESTVDINYVNEYGEEIEMQGRPPPWFTTLLY